jgi:hypothetical protein
MNNETWFVVKTGNGKFCPRITNDTVGPFWPFGPAEFDTLDEAVYVLKNVKEFLDRKKNEKEEIVFEL